MKVFKKLFLPFDELSGRIPPADMRAAVEAASRDLEMVPYDPDEHGDVEMVWMTDGERELTEADKLGADVVRLKPRK